MILCCGSSHAVFGTLPDDSMDRMGKFELQVLKKNQISISQNIEEKILSMQTKGVTTGDTETHIQDRYGFGLGEHCQSDHR